ncbi:Rho termination factor N-terminal domain-containing protein [Streptococcus infantarius]|uniref:Rho termination factor N-terminal domain-containing protein n=1 Tax=Streptococcus infantarius TaxID=102684 RepID=UPI000DA367D0|nr:Rho termination factor N-terminal domain-containing protein [Streptococcus infantarius]MCO4504118.1 hypothetical protein [Streptococcus infantarius subsp. infantarius]SQI07666.1 transcription termination factor [Streptococcus pasteurianus]
MGVGLLRRHYAKKEVVDLSEKTLTELKAMAKEKSIEGYSTLNKEALIEALKE